MTPDYLDYYYYLAIGYILHSLWTFTGIPESLKQCKEYMDHTAGSETMQEWNQGSIHVFKSLNKKKPWAMPLFIGWSVWAAIGFLTPEWKFFLIFPISFILATTMSLHSALKVNHKAMAFVAYAWTAVRMIVVSFPIYIHFFINQ